MHFLREHGESPGHAICEKLHVATPLITTQVSTVHGSLSLHTLLLVVEQSPVLGSQTAFPQAFAVALHTTGLDGVHLHMSVPGIGTGVMVAHLVWVQTNGIVRQTPFSHFFGKHGLVVVQLIHSVLLQLGIGVNKQFPVASSQESLVQLSLSLQFFPEKIHPRIGSQDATEQRFGGWQLKVDAIVQFPLTQALVRHLLSVGWLGQIVFGFKTHFLA